MHQVLDPHLALCVPVGKRLAKKEGNTDLLSLLQVPKILRRVQRRIQITRRHRDHHFLPPYANQGNGRLSAWIAYCKQRSDYVSVRRCQRFRSIKPREAPWEVCGGDND